MITHMDLIETCEEIGMVAERTSGFTYGLTHQLASKSFDTMTVAELLTHIRQRTVQYNRLFENQTL